MIQSVSHIEKIKKEAEGIVLQ